MATSDNIVTARIPKEIRDQGDAALKRIDSTVTELVNAAFEYVIKTGELPTTVSKPRDPSKKTVRRFTPEQKTQFSRYLKETSLPLSPEYASLTAKQIKAMRLEEKYGM